MNLFKLFKKNEVVNSVIDNFRTKTTNPFFGTLIVVWMFHNWRLVYKVFNFDRNTKVDTKIDFIKDYLDGWGFIWNLLLCVAIAFGVLVITYLFLGLSRYISEKYEEIALPWIHSLNGDSKIVSRRKYLDLEEDWRGIKKSYETEKELRLKAEAEKNELKNKMNSSFKEIERTSLESSLKRDEDKINAFMSEISSDKERKSSFRYLELIKNGEPIIGNVIIAKLLKYGLIDRKKDEKGAVYSDFYILTGFGDRYLRYYTIINPQN
jgi:hypothetical protein